MRRLVLRPGAIGDFILSFPAIEALRSDYTEVWAPRAVCPLIRFADRVRALSSTGIDLIGIGVEPPRHTLEALRAFDDIVSWYGANRPEFRETVHAMGLPFRFYPALPRGDEGLHAADFFLRQVGGSGPATPRIDCSPLQTGGDFTVIHPFSGSPRKNWPLDRYRELAARLPIPVRWCAGPEEDLEGAVRFDDLYELGRWLASARLYIGNDSGITHLAAAVGVRVVAIFTATDPAVWGPRGERVQIVRGTPAVEEIVRYSSEKAT